MNSNNQNNSEEELPRRESSLYNLNHPNSEIKEKILKKYKRIYKYLVIPLYKVRLLPLLGFGRVFLILIHAALSAEKKAELLLIKEFGKEYEDYKNIVPIFLPKLRKRVN